MAQGKNPCVSVKVMVMGPLDNNVYIISDDEATFVVDPTEYASFIVDALDGRKLDAIVMTHAHWDHVGGACDLRRLTGAQTIASPIDAPYIMGEKILDSSHNPYTPCPVDKMVVDGEELVIGNMKWKVLETPGHTRGSICLFLDPQYGSDPDGAPVLISGDTLFHGAHGRTDRRVARAQRHHHHCGGELAFPNQVARLQQRLGLCCKLARRRPFRHRASTENPSFVRLHCCYD